MGYNDLFQKNIGDTQKWPAKNNEYNVYEWRSTWLAKTWTDIMYTEDKTA
jgi:hypothetical protein